MENENLLHFDGSSRLKIIHVPHAYYPVLGGAEIHAQKISEELAQMGHEVFVITTNVSSVHGYFHFSSTTLNITTTTLNGVKMLTVDYGSRSMRNIGDCITLIPWTRPRIILTSWIWKSFQRKFEKTLEKNILEFKPDVLMTMPHVLPNVSAAINVAKRTGTPLVLVPLLHQQDSKSIVESYSDSITKADSIVTNTENERQYIVRRFSINKEKVFTGRLGTDVKNNLVADSTRSTNQVLYLGRQAKSKRVDQLLLAMGEVWKTNKSANLVIAGAEDDATKELSDLVDSLDPSNKEHVRLLTNINNDTKNHLLATSTCLVLPSPHESFGLVILEAWANRIPVIALDLPVFREIISDKKDGLLVKPGDVYDLSNAIVSIINEPISAKMMGSSGLEKVLEKYSWRQVARRYLVAYRYAIDTVSEN